MKIPCTGFLVKMARYNKRCRGADQSRLKQTSAKRYWAAHSVKVSELFNEEKTIDIKINLQRAGPEEASHK
jgi:hypothetical protein